MTGYRKKPWKYLPQTPNPGRLSMKKPSRCLRHQLRLSTTNTEIYSTRNYPRIMGRFLSIEHIGGPESELSRTLIIIRLGNWCVGPESNKFTQATREYVGNGWCHRKKLDCIRTPYMRCFDFIESRTSSALYMQFL